MHEFCDGTDIEFEEDLASVRLNGSDAYEELRRDLFVAFTLSEKLHYLYFARG